MCVQHRVVRLHNRCGDLDDQPHCDCQRFDFAFSVCLRKCPQHHPGCHHLRRGIDGESELGLLAVVDGEALHQEGGKAGTWTETLVMVGSCGGDVYNEEEEEKLDDGENDSAGTRPETLMRVVG